LVVIVAALAMSGCSASSNSTEVPEESFQPSASGPLSRLTVAVPIELQPAIEEIAEQFAENTGGQIVIRITPSHPSIAELSDLLSATSGIDIISVSQNHLDTLIDFSLLAPLKLDGQLSGFVPTTVEAYKRGDILYGIPFSIETSGLICEGSSPTQADQAAGALIMEFDRQSGNAYQTNFLRTSFGLSILRDKADGGFEDSSGLFEGGYFKYLEWLVSAKDEIEFVEFGLGLERLFQLPGSCLVTGPYDLHRLADGSSREFHVKGSLPEFGPLPAKPFLESGGFVLVANSDHAEAGREFLLSYLASAAAQQSIYDLTGQISPNLQVELSEWHEPFREASMLAQPRPGNKVLRDIWFPLGRAEADIVLGGKDPLEIWGELRATVSSILEEASQR